MTQRIGLYGGSFDPIHFGHLIIARSIAEQLDLARVILIPAPRPPHKLNQLPTDARYRLEMARLAVEGDPLFDVSDIELHRHGPSYTFDTVQEFHRLFGPTVELYWIIGADSLPELPSWYRIRDLVASVNIVCAERPGANRLNESELAFALGEEAAKRILARCLKTPKIEISATEIRQRVAMRRPIMYLVPEAVRSYIYAHGLYL